MKDDDDGKIVDLEQIRTRAANVVFERDGKLWTTSREVAKEFRKEHKNILGRIDNTLCSQ